MAKINLCVIFGGASSEHEVSLLSAASVLRNIDPDKYEVHKLAISKEGGWYYYDGDAEGLSNLNDPAQWNFDRACISPDRTQKTILRFGAEGLKTYPVDVVFPVLHGKNGEDGTVQGLLELAGIPYVGSGVIGSAACMDKCIAKALFERAGIAQAAWVEMKKGEKKIDEVEEKLGYPCFVKPANAGSSVGITKAHNRSELEEGIALAFLHDEKLLVEEMMTGTEVESSVMGNLDPVCAPVVGEIAPAAEFYDYDAKYNNAASVLTIPAKLQPEIVEKLRENAVKAYRACECRGLSRVDFFVEKETGKVFLNEINTMPGFTSISMYAKLWEASGVSYSELIDRLIALALDNR
ncbi:D-alanine--D-alanine ligase family protein [Ructibacterium gallinarum]|uniref:D-alanine--D-alanine ligase n=1 Tax=Ructibacterium gallinarum TaxID=2779355 RepID=A0A9D5RBE4_9FIRM|nr:D-alanine--D-alanine ligase family protein [Ructibacterium gallinarum]MBE5039943.1 D-alanine--D-alanine ligase [Ructibacterium gallinarum]